MKIQLAMNQFGRYGDKYEYDTYDADLMQYIKFADDGKPKFRLTKEQMIEFNDDVNEACNQCAGYHNDSLIEDRDIYRKEITPSGLVRHWKGHAGHMLFTSGYSAYLTEYAVDVFAAHKVFRSLKKIWKLMNPTC